MGILGCVWANAIGSLNSHLVKALPLAHNPLEMLHILWEPLRLSDFNLSSFQIWRRARQTNDAQTESNIEVNANNYSTDGTICKKISENLTSANF